MTNEPARIRLGVWLARTETQVQELAAILGVSGEHLSNIKSGRCEPGALLKPRIMEATGIDWDAPVEPTPDPSEEVTLDLPAASGR